jgi:hypothetical protein
MYRETDRAILTGVAEGWRRVEERLRHLSSCQICSALCGMFDRLDCKGRRCYEFAVLMIEEIPQKSDVNQNVDADCS